MRLPALLRHWPTLLLLLVVVQAPLILNPGWFSHDELQWAARTDVARFADLPWVAWTDFATFQFRPLTFNLWLALSWLAFDTPWLMHALFVLTGSVNALLLASALQAAAVPRRVAFAAAIAFVLSPFVVYVHGWVGTLADLLVLLAALLGMRLLQLTATSTRLLQCAAAIAIVLLTVAALLCKESAIVLPAALLLALYRHPRPRVALAMIAATGIPVLAYLGLHLTTVLTTPTGSESYAWAVRHVPQRLAEYLLFPFLPAAFEVGTTLTKSATRLLAATLSLGIVLTVLGRLGWRWPAVWLVSVAALLAPVLLLAASAGQYAYLASAAAIGIGAAAWPGLARTPRIALGCVTAVAVVHGAQIMAGMVHVGTIQRNFDRDLRALVTPGTPAPLIAPAAGAETWMLKRFVHEVPQYHGARLAQPGEAPVLLMQADGHLVPLR